MSSVVVALTRSTRTILLDASLSGLNNPNLVNLGGGPLPRILSTAIHEMVHALDHIANLKNSDLGVKEGWSDDRWWNIKQ